MATDPCNRIEPVLRLKSAAAADVTIGGKLWKADGPYRVGNFLLDNLEDRTSAVGGTDEDELYRSYMSSGKDFDVLGYAIPKLSGRQVPGADALCRKLLRHGTRQLPGRSRLAGVQRGAGRHDPLANLDISGEVGPKFALVADFEVEVTDGLLNAQFTPSANRLAISALELYRLVSTTTMTFAVQQAEPVCGAKVGGTATVANLKGGTPPYAYRWSSSPAQTGASAAGLPPGEQSVTVTDAQGCTRTEKFAVTENPYCAGFRVNAGGAAYVTADSVSFIADTYYRAARRPTRWPARWPLRPTITSTRPAGGATRSVTSSRPATVRSGSRCTSAKPTGAHRGGGCGFPALPRRGGRYAPAGGLRHFCEGRGGHAGSAGNV
jgi:hypothetical protein